ncbi:hypothetical protein OAF54_00910 [bacterium]|nr:hypothetical protein [bacterium]
MNTQARQFQLYVVRPTLDYMGVKFTGLAAERLLIGTMLTESGGRFIDQKQKANDLLGPAVGLWQMERKTHDDIWDNYLNFRADLHQRISHLKVDWPTAFEHLAGNNFYACAMARLKYWRVKPPLPDADDLEGLANYWKYSYNTSQGKGTVEDFMTKAKPIMNLTED